MIEDWMRNGCTSTFINSFFSPAYNLRIHMFAIQLAIISCDRTYSIKIWIPFAFASGWRRVTKMCLHLLFAPQGMLGWNFSTRVKEVCRTQVYFDSFGHCLCAVYFERNTWIIPNEINSEIRFDGLTVVLHNCATMGTISGNTFDHLLSWCDAIRCDAIHTHTRTRTCTHNDVYCEEAHFPICQSSLTINELLLHTVYIQKPYSTHANTICVCARACVCLLKHDIVSIH